MGTSVSTPAPRSMAEEGRETLQAQIDLAPDQYAARQQFDPLYADLNVATLRRALLGDGQSGGMLQLYQDIEPQLTNFTNAATSNQRQRDVADVETLGPRATAALRASDPQAAALEDMLAQQAMDQLSSGASLDPQLRDQVAQEVRSAQAARGFGFSGSDADVEGLFLGREANAMRQQRQGFAADVAARRRATTGDPFMAILGRPSSVVGQAGSVMGQAGGAASGAPSFDPFTSYAADLYNTNFNAKAAANIAEANNKTALASAGIQAAGSAASAM